MIMKKFFNNKWYTLVVLLIAQRLIISDNTGLSISTANIISKLNTTLGQVQFSLAVYPMIAGSLMIAGSMIIPAVLGMIPGIYYGKDRVKAFSLSR